MKANSFSVSSTGEKYHLKLYVSGMAPKSMEAIKNIKRLCTDYLMDAYDLEIIDIYKNPAQAVEQHIVFCPSLVKSTPLPRKTLIGSLHDTAKVLAALGVDKK